MRNLIIFAAIFCFSFSAHATNIDSEAYHEISKLGVHTNENALTSEWNGTTVVYLSTPINWVGETQCNNTRVLIKKGDDHILSSILAAYLAKKKVKLFVNDTYNISN